MVVFGNSKAAPELVNSKTSVFWGIECCPVPEGYDARRVRPSIESALKNLGYMGSVTISAMGDLEKIPCQVLQGLSSTGVAVTHCLSEMVNTHFFDDIDEFKSLNPPPATIMIISDNVAEKLAPVLSVNQQYRPGYNLVLASTYPTSAKVTSYLYTSAEWLWKTILADDQQETSFSEVLHKCSESSTEFFADHANLLPQALQISPPISPLKKHKQREINIVDSRKPDPGYSYGDVHPKGKIVYLKSKRRLRMGFRTFHLLLTQRRSFGARRLARRGTL